MDIYPKISIVTPCFNSEKYLESTIKSVLGQEYPNLEYIIVDGDSKDNTLKIIKKYEAKLAFWISEKDNGMYDAIKKGFNKSTGEIMAWIGSDDMYHPKAFYTVAEIFSKFKNVEWLLGSNTGFDEQGRTISAYPSRKFLREDFLDRDYEWLQQESCFWRRTLWEKAGGVNETLRYAGDFELWIKFFRHTSLYVTPALIGGFRFRNSGQLSLEHLDKYYQEAEEILEKEESILNKTELKQLKTYKTYKKISKLLELVEKIPRKSRRYLMRKFHTVKHVSFDRASQEFYMK